MCSSDLHHWAPGDGEGSGHGAGWAAAAGRVPEPDAAVTMGRRGRSVTFSTADQKALLAEIFGSVHAVYEGERWTGDGSDSFDLTPAIFHALLQRSNNSQSSQGVVDIDPTSRVRPLPLVSAEVRMEELGVPVENPTLNVNTASVAELQERLDLGSSDAESLVQWRYRHGPFSFLESTRAAGGRSAYRKLLSGAATDNQGEIRRAHV